MNKRFKIFIIVILVFVLLLVGFVAKDSVINFFEKSVSQHITDIDDYESILGKEGKYKEHFNRYNDIFPDEIEEGMDVQEFCYSYFDLADPCYMGYLVLELDDETFNEERLRLENIKSSKNTSVYGTTGFYYEVLAIYADDYYGYIYALADYEKNQIIYVELQFCNGIMDINYYETIDEKYLPIGFDVYVEYEFLK